MPNRWSAFVVFERVYQSQRNWCKKTDSQRIYSRWMSRNWKSKQNKFCLNEWNFVTELKICTRLKLFRFFLVSGVTVTPLSVRNCVNTTANPTLFHLMQKLAIRTGFSWEGLGLEHPYTWVTFSNVHAPFIEERFSFATTFQICDFCNENYRNRKTRKACLFSIGERVD